MITDLGGIPCRSKSSASCRRRLFSLERDRALRTRCSLGLRKLIKCATGAYLSQGRPAPRPVALRRALSGSAQLRRPPTLEKQLRWARVEPVVQALDNSVSGLRRHSGQGPTRRHFRPPPPKEPIGKAAWPETIDECSQALAPCGLTGHKKRARIPSGTTQFERSEILVPVAVGHVGILGFPLRQFK